MANKLIPQRALKHQSPIQALQKWRSEKPELLVERVEKHPGLDNSVVPAAGPPPYRPVAATNARQSQQLWRESQPIRRPAVQMAKGSMSTAHRNKPLCWARRLCRPGSQSASMRCKATREGDSTSICMRSTSASLDTCGGTTG